MSLDFCLAPDQHRRDGLHTVLDGEPHCGICSPEAEVVHPVVGVKGHEQLIPEDPFPKDTSDTRRSAWEALYGRKLT